MSKGTVFIKSASPRSNWLGALIKTLKIDVEVVDIDKSSEFEKLFPLKKTPAFADAEGYKLTEILAIVEYLFSLSNDKVLRGKNPKDSAQVMRWLSYVNQDIVNTWCDYIFVQKSEQGKKATAEVLASQLKYINDELAIRSYLAVDGYATVADEYLFSWYAALAEVAGDVTTAKYPYLIKWYENLKKRDAVAKEVAKL
jgi:elongation factor 1-gamma